jgi:hypothetical protein
LTCAVTHSSTCSPQAHSLLGGALGVAAALDDQRVADGAAEPAHRLREPAGHVAPDGVADVPVARAHVEAGDLAPVVGQDDHLRHFRHLPWCWTGAKQIFA